MLTSEMLLSLQRIESIHKQLVEGQLDPHRERDALIYLGSEASLLAWEIEQKLAPWNISVTK